jgi:hypothetical protein
MAIYKPMALILGGGALAVYGLARRSWGGLALAAVGGALVQRGVRGCRSGSLATSRNRQHLRQRLTEGNVPPIQARSRPQIDLVEEASKESFPASDAPAWIGRNLPD